MEFKDSASRSLNLNLKPNNQKGILVTFCGLDGCGKTTLMKKFIEYLSFSENKKEIFLTKQPTNEVRNSLIFRTFMDCPNHDAYNYLSLSLLAASDRVQHGSKVIEPALKEGKIVLSDRYFYSCLANFRARGYKKDRWIYDISKNIVKPDIAFFFDVSVKKAVERVRSRPKEKYRYIDMDLQHRLKKEYIDICKSNNGILISTEDSSVEECTKTMIKEFERMQK